EVGVVQSDVRDVFNRWVSVSTAPGRYAPRVAAQDVIDDGQVVRGQVPDDVHVRLEQPQVDPDAVHVQQVAQLPAVHELPDPADRVGEQVGVIDHQHPAGPVGDVDQVLGLLHSCGQRLLDQDVQPGLQAAGGQREMRGHRGRDGNRVRFEVEQLVDRRNPVHVRVAAGDRLQPGRAGVAHRDYFGERASGEVADQVRAPVPVPDDSDAQAVH